VDYDGNIVIHEWTTIEVGRCWKMFKTCLELWKLQKRHNPKMEIAA